MWHHLSQRICLILLLLDCGGAGLYYWGFCISSRHCRSLAFRNDCQLRRAAQSQWLTSNRQGVSLSLLYINIYSLIAVESPPAGQIVNGHMNDHTVTLNMNNNNNPSYSTKGDDHPITPSDDGSSIRSNPNITMYHK
jgi:hypothetical protein